MTMPTSGGGQQQLDPTRRLRWPFPFAAGACGAAADPRSGGRVCVLAAGGGKLTDDGGGLKKNEAALSKIK